MRPASWLRDASPGGDVLAQVDLLATRPGPLLGATIHYQVTESGRLVDQDEDKIDEGGDALREEGTSGNLVALSNQQLLEPLE